MTLKKTIKNIKKSKQEYFNTKIILIQSHLYNGYDLEEWIFGDYNFTTYHSDILKNFIKKEGLKVYLKYMGYRKKDFLITNKDNLVQWKQV